MQSLDYSYVKQRLANDGFCVVRRGVPTSKGDLLVTRLLEGSLTLRGPRYDESRIASRYLHVFVLLRIYFPSLSVVAYVRNYSQASQFEF